VAAAEQQTLLDLIKALKRLIDLVTGLCGGPFTDRQRNDFDNQEIVACALMAEAGIDLPPSTTMWSLHLRPYGLSSLPIQGYILNAHNLVDPVAGEPVRHWLARLLTVQTVAENRLWSAAGIGPGRAPVVPGAPARPAAGALAAAAEYLMNWPDILNEVGLKNTDEDRRTLRALNDKYKGPIIMPRRGGRPKVDRGKLRPWWNGLESRWVQEEQGRRDSEEAKGQRGRDRKETTRERHNYGRNGEVVPGIAGHVKPRRRKPGPQQ
jgi:hypothetical protein